ncbi:MAG: hypothetical protein J6U04_06315 [Salinivirgaceae bacterium]|nr:hypothetical protein [Salinivirgaceae bacterium]
MAELKLSAFVGTKIASAKSEFEARLGSINQTVANGVMSGQIQSVDFALYVVRSLEDQSTVDLFKSGDAEEVGMTNINKRQLDANTYMLITHIQLLAANVESNSALTDEQLKKAEYNEISNLIANGEFELLSNSTVLIPRVSCEVFRKPAGNGNVAGDWVLECPKMLVPLTNIDAKLRIPASSKFSTGSGNEQKNYSVAVKLVLNGVKTHRS